MRKLLNFLSGLVLALLIVAGAPEALAAGNLNFGVDVTPETRANVGNVLAVRTADTDEAAFAALAAEGKVLSFTTACGFENAYVVYGGTLVSSALADDSVRFPVGKSGEYLVVDGTAPKVTVTEGKITVEVSEQNAAVLDSFTVPCTLQDVTVMWGETKIEATAGSGTLTFPLEKAGEYVITGTESPSGPVVEEITIQSQSDSVEVGKSLTFTATVTGTNVDDVEVRWTLSGNTDPQTTITADGVLTVGPNETAENLTITASAGDKNASVQIKVTRPNPNPPSYKLTKGDKSKWTKGSGKQLTFAADADISLLTSVEVDGKALNARDYEVAGDEIRLKSSFLETLHRGSHTIRLCYSDGGTATGSFSVKLSVNNAFTGDQFPLTLLLTTLTLSLTGLTVVLIAACRKKK